VGLLFTGPEGQRLSVLGYVWVFIQTVMRGGCPHGFACPPGAKLTIHIAIRPSPLESYVRGGRRGDAVRRAPASRLPPPGLFSFTPCSTFPRTHSPPDLLGFLAQPPPPDRILSVAAAAVTTQLQVEDDGDQHHRSHWV
jgi:hypothetical protein